MTTTVTNTFSITMKTSKTVSTTDPTISGQPSVNMDLQIPAMNMSGTSAENSTEAWSGEVSLTAGAATLDLTNLPATPGTSFGAVDATGLKLKKIQVLAPGANAAAVQIGTGASNGYSAAGVIGPLKPGGHATLYTPDSIAVDGTHKTLDLAGTGTDKLRVHLVFGT